jgi:hypothetical protein
MKIQEVEVIVVGRMALLSGRPRDDGRVQR